MSSEPTLPARRTPAKRFLVALLLFPPLGWLRLWRSDRSVSRRLLWTLAGGVWVVPWAAGMLGILIVLTPLDLEWDGGFPPVLTFSKTVPDYQAVEQSRAAQSAQVGAASAAQGPGYWTGFRGPLRDGHYQEAAIRTNWAAEPPRLLWKQPIGAGYASFAIAEGRAFTIEQRRDQESVTAYDVQTGRELWVHAYPALFSEAMGGDGPRATPCVDEGRVYALGATGEFRCLEAATGRVLWGTNILGQHDARNLHWAQSASPLVVGDTVIVCPGGPGGRSVVAYDKRLGEVRWTGADGEAAYSSPVVLELLGERQLIVAVKDRILGLVPEGPGAGTLRWEFPWTVLQNNRNIAQPLQLGPDRLLLSAGYGTGSVALEVTRQAGDWSAREIWRTKRFRNKFCSSVLWQGHVYGMDEEVLACLDAATGEQKWREGRYGHGQLVLAGGHLVILGVAGDLALVQARPDRWLEVARLPALAGKTWNHPAIDGGRLLVRNLVEMACYDLR